MSDPDEQPQHRWFWWPLPFWKVLLIFLGTNLAGNLLWGGVATALNLSSSFSIGGGIGGASGALIVIYWSRKLRKKLGH